LEAVHAPVADIRGAEVVHPVGEIHMRTDALENPEERSQRRSSFAENENKGLISKNMSSSCCCFGEDEEEELARQVANAVMLSTEDCQFCGVADHHRHSSANCEMIPFSFAADQQCVYGTNEER
jgi:hypothetical protein